MLLIAGTFRLPPDKLPEARPSMRTMIESSRAEDGCHQYSYAEDLLDAGLIHVSELWSGQPALDRHFATAHITSWRAAGPSLGIHDRNLRIYEVAEPRSL